MASESENSPRADDTVLVDSSAAANNEQSPAGDAWPVTDLYYVEPDEDAPVHSAGDPDDGISPASPFLAMITTRKP